MTDKDDRKHSASGHCNTYIKGNIKLIFEKRQPHPGCLYVVLPYHFILTIPANVFPFKPDNALRAAAEDAGGFIFFQHNLILFHKDFQVILFADVQGSSQLDGEYDPTKLVHFSDNSYCFHAVSFLFLTYDGDRGGRIPFAEIPPAFLQPGFFSAVFDKSVFSFISLSISYYTMN